METKKREYGTREKDNYKNWLSKQKQLSIKIDPDFDVELKAHAAGRGESVRQFVIRSIKTTIDLDNNEISADADNVTRDDTKQKEPEIDLLAIRAAMNAKRAAAGRDPDNSSK